MKAGEVKEAGGQYLVGNEMCPVGYKLTEVGIIPEDWDATTIGENTRWSSGGTPSRKRADYWEGAVPWISGSTLKTLEIFTSDQFLTPEGVASGSNMAPVNATLLLVRGSALHKHIRVGLVVSPVSFNQDVKSLLPIGSVLPKFLTFYIKGMENDLLKLVSSAGNSAGVLDTELVKKFKFLRPGVKEQTAIANALSDVDALITSLEKLIAKKRAIKIAAMQQLLTGKKRLPPFDKTHTGYKQTELGEIPDDWEVVSLGKIARFYKGKGLPKADLVAGGKNECIHYGELFTRYSEVVNDVISKTNANYEVFLSEENDVLMPTSDVTPNGLATASSIKKSGVILGGDVLVIRPKKESLDSSFFAYLISISKDKIMQLVTGSTVYHLYGSDMATFIFAKPSSVDEQVAITEVLIDLNSEILSLEKRLKKNQQLKQGMMQELLTGRTRLV